MAPQRPEFRMTVKDEIIEEIRKSRREISAECGHEQRAFANYMEKQNTVFATQVAAWKKLEENRSHETPRHPGDSKTSIVAEEPPLS